MSASAQAVAVEAPAVEIPAQALNRGLITVSVMGASIMQAIDTTIATIALPHMQGSLSGTQDQMVWVLTSYIVAAAIMTPLSGWLAGRIGRKKVFFYSIVGFTITSALCGMAESVFQIVLFRALQGVCGAALIPLSQAILLDINPRERHGRAMAIWGMGVVMGPILGPMLGGWLTEDYSWRWVFYVNVPFGILAAIGIAASLPETRKVISRFDLFGFATLSIGIGALQLMLDRGELKDWFSSPEIVLEAMAAALALYLFVVHMLTHDAPFIGRALFKDRNFVVGNVFIFIVGVVLFATLALLPPLLQVFLGYPVLLAGLVTAPRGLGTWVAMAVVGRMIGRVDARWLIATGFGLAALSLVQMAGFSPLMGTSPVIWSGVIQGFGAGLAWVAISSIAFISLSPELRNEGAALFNLTRNIGASVGISVIQAMVTSGTQEAHATLTPSINPFNLAARQPDVFAQISSPQGLAALNSQITTQAGWLAYIDAFHLMAYITLLVVPLLFLVRRSKAPQDAAPVAVE